ncbi:MAG: hypothetical protein JKY94_17880 [Rhodobacteraceae bacterium]|nr:hypothetical protein [Paracoccaceae bacterium]
MAEEDRTVNDLDPVDDATGFNFVGADPTDNILSRMTHEAAAKALSAPTVFPIFDAGDLADLAVGNVITVTGKQTIVFLADIAADIKFVIEPGGDLALITVGVAGSYTWGGTGSLFSGGGTLILGMSLALSSGGTGTLFDLTFDNLGSVRMGPSRYAGFDSLGTITGGSCFGTKAFFVAWDEGLTFDNMVIVDMISTVTSEGSSTNDLITIKDTGVVPSAIPPIYRFTDSILSLVGTGAGFFLDPDISDRAQVAIVNGTVTGGGGLYNTDGTTGTFTAVDDASISATVVSSVTDSGGVARFNFTGPAVYVGQEVELSTFTLNPDYNVTGVITAEDVGYFEIATIAFGSDEAGSFLSNSTTVTDVGTALVDGDTLVLDTDGATDYDGGATVYNQLTDSFQVNRLYAGTKTGAWDTGGLDQTDPRVKAVDQRNERDSKEIASASVTGNTTPVGTIINGTFTDIVFGTEGDALVVGTTMERFKLVDPVKGILEYTGREAFDGSIRSNFTAVSAGGLVEFLFRWQVDTGSGFGDLPDDIKSLVSVGSDASSVSQDIPLRLETGDRIQPEITRNSGGSAITVSHATIFASQ